MRATVAIALSLSALLIAPAQAINRYNADQLACAEIRAIIRDDGAAIMRYRSKRDPSLILYDRYVRDRFFCAWREDVEAAWIPSQDKAQCRVWRCAPATWREDMLFRRFRHGPEQ